MYYPPATTPYHIPSHSIQERRRREPAGVSPSWDLSSLHSVMKCFPARWGVSEEPSRYAEGCKVTPQRILFNDLDIKQCDGPEKLINISNTSSGQQNIPACSSILFLQGNVGQSEISLIITDGQYSDWLWVYHESLTNSQGTQFYQLPCLSQGRSLIQFLKEF